MIMILSSQLPSFLLLLLLLVIFSHSLQMQALESAEGRALLEWKETSLSNTDGVLDSWSLSNLKNICNWTGITCNTATDVSEINLSGYYNNFNLSGTLYSFGFVSFPKLTRLVLYYNSFSGSIPSAIANLSKLTFLDLSQNYFESNIPLGITMLNKLRYLDLSGNSFIGTFPNQFGHIHNLQHLDITMNYFSGQFPESIFSNLSKLQSFYCRSNLFQGPFPTIFTSLSMLKIIDLYENYFYGIIPQQLTRLTNLIELDLGWNNFLGSIPPQIGNLNNLEILCLEHNHFSGPIPSTIRNMTNLGQLLLANNNLSGIILSQMGIGSSLTLSSSLESWLSNLNSLGTLDLSKNNLHGPLPHCLWNFSNYLWFVDLSINQFEGTIPADFAEENWLKFINLKGNHLGGPLPRGLVNCSMLKVLDVGNNKLVDSFPHWLDVVSYLGVLILRSNHFYGTIVGTSKTKRPFQKLHIFDISHNEFIGHLPWYYLENFEEMQNASATGDDIYLSNDDYIDLVLKRKELPVGNFNIFTLIDLSNNHFNGEIPEFIGKLHYIRFLNLSHNDLTGYIPSSLGNLSILETLDLSSNQLVGEIPEQLAKSLTFLAIFNLSYNHLVGPIPHGPQFNTFNNDSYLGNTGLCGSPLTLQCQGSGPPPQAAASGGGDSQNFEWRSVVAGYCCGMPFGIVVGYLAFLYGRPRWFVRAWIEKRSERAG